jgi:hypothetical protein
LDPAVAWPRVQTLLGPEQHQLEADARTDLAFLTNGAVGATTVSLVAAGNWLAGGAWNGRGLGIAGGVVVAVAFYRLASNAAHKWVVDVQGSFVDTYRYELYGRLGVSKPDSHAEELRVADQLSTFLRRGLRGEDLFGSSSSDGAPRDK